MPAYRRLWAPLLVGLALVTVACTSPGGPGTESTQTPGSPQAGPATTETSAGVFQAYLRQPSSIDPGRAIDAEEITVVDQLFDSLTTTEMDGDEVTVTPGAAASWEANPAPSGDAPEDAPPAATVWTFTLREGATFHDGTPVTAADFKRGWERIADRTSEQPSAAFYLLEPVVGFATAAEGGELSGVEAVDQRTLRVTLDRPLADLPAVVSHPALAPVPAAAASDAAGFAELPVGNGPFRMADALQPARFVRLEPFDGYVGPAPAPRIEEIVFQFYSGDTAIEDAYTEFEDGFLEFAPVPTDRFEQALETYGRSGDGFSGTGVLDGIELITAFYGFNDDLAPFDDPALRRAISLLIDRDAIVSDVVPAGRAVATSVVPPGIAGYEPAECGFCTYEPDQARGLLEGKEIPPFELVYYEGAGHDAIAERVQRDVNAVLGEGTLTLRPLPQAEWLERLRSGETGFFLSGWLAEYPAADTFLYPLFHADRIGQDNLSHYDNPQVNELLDRARQELDPSARADLYRQAEALVLEDMPVVPLFHYRHAQVVADRVEGFSLSPLGHLDLTRVTVRPQE